MEKKCLISKGHVNKYIFFAVIAGLSKCFVTLMVYIFQDYATYNKHPLIIGFNAGLGMSLSIIPLIIVKTKSRREKKNNNLKVKQILSNDTKSISTVCNPNYLEKYNKKKIKTPKISYFISLCIFGFFEQIFDFFLKKISHQQYMDF